MFERVTVHASDLEASAQFYAMVLAVLGLEPDGTAWGAFAVAPADDDRPVTRRLHIGFAAASQELVDRFWEVGTAAGHRDDGPPGLRPQYGPDYYGGFLLDPDGNSAEAVHHDRVRPDATIDHLWIRVADVPASRDFYRPLGFVLGADEPERVQFRNPSGPGSFSLVAGTPTEHVTMAFRAAAPQELTDPDGNRVELVS